MPFYQCPRCGGTDSYGQWEQRFNSRDITYRDNQNRQVGSSNGGFGVSNVRQQYCTSCMSVKMDLKFNEKDFTVIGNLALVLLAVFIGYQVIREVIYYSSNLKNGISEGSSFDILTQQSNIFYFISGLSFLLGCLALAFFRKALIKKEDKKFLKDRFYKPKRQRSKKFFFIWYLVAFITINAIYLSITA